jgi:hypothetical protein
MYILVSGSYSIVRINPGGSIEKTPSRSNWFFVLDSFGAAFNGGNVSLGEMVFAGDVSRVADTGLLPGTGPLAGFVVFGIVEPGLFVAGVLVAGCCCA